MDTEEMMSDSDVSEIAPKGYGKHLSDDGELVLKERKDVKGVVEGKGARPKPKRKRDPNDSPEKKKKPVDPKTEDEVVIVTAVNELESDGAKVVGKKKLKKKGAAVMISDATDVIKKMKGYSAEVTECLLTNSVEGAVVVKVLGVCSKYEEMMMQLVAENERLKGRLEGAGRRTYTEDGGFAAPAPVAMLPVAHASVPAVSSASVAVETVSAHPKIAKPVETWSVVVKGKSGVTSEDVVKKVVKEVGPTLGVRVHDIRPVRGGGAVIRTPSVAEREKVVANSKFAEVGLEISVKDKLGPKVVVQKVLTDISTDVFMEDLYEMNLKEMMTKSAFTKSVRLVSSPWKTSPEGHVSVLLEVTNGVMEKLVGDGVYIKWFRFVARIQDPVRSCYRCLGFDHEVRVCKFKENVCRRCGLTGHLVSQCCNPVKCRNCALKGYPSGHMMLSSACPIVASKIAVVNSRH